jgi:competence CoiA-like predicted nuclease
MKVMLTALYEGTVIEIDDYKSPKEELDPKLLTCPICGENVFVKHGIIKRAHFSHYSNATCNFERLQGERETEEHRLLKRYMADDLRKRFPKASVKLEVPILNRKRIVDVMATLPFGYKIIIECQCSNISNAEIDARMSDYEQLGLVEVGWIFKKGVRAEHDTQRLRERCEFIGFCEFLE